ncbi:MAG: hypothetical protein J4432_04105 [DPANN group archaeon]|nr:hypothetical protein [DPANN group archaeon]
MELPEINIDKSILIAAVAVIVVAVLALVYIVPIVQPRSVNAYFEQSTLSLGETTRLYVEVTNLFTKDLEAVQVSVKAIDPTTISIPESQRAIAQQNVGIGEMKKFEFPVTVLNAREGTYSIEITVDFDGKIERQRAMLRVRSS